MAYPNNQQVEPLAESWTTCKVSVITHLGFKCDCPVGNSASAHKVIRPVWDKGKLNLPEQMMVLFISMERQNIGYHAAFMRVLDRTYGNPRYLLTLALHTLACSVILGAQPSFWSSGAKYGRYGAD